MGAEDTERPLLCDLYQTMMLSLEKGARPDEGLNPKSFYSQTDIKVRRLCRSLLCFDLSWEMWRN